MYLKLQSLSTSRQNVEGSTSEPFRSFFRREGR